MIIRSILEIVSFEEIGKQAGEPAQTQKENQTSKTPSFLPAPAVTLNRLPLSIRANIIQSCVKLQFRVFSLILIKQNWLKVEWIFPSFAEAI
jgi:hypothetical protein